MRNNLDFPLTLLAYLYRITQITHAIVDLDLVVEEFLEGRNVENLV